MKRRLKKALWGVLALGLAGGGWLVVSKPAQHRAGAWIEAYWPPAVRAKAHRQQQEAAAESLLQELMTLRQAASIAEWRGDFSVALKSLGEARRRQAQLIQDFAGTPATCRLLGAGKGNAVFEAKLKTLEELERANELWQWLWLASVRGNDIPQERLALEISRVTRLPLSTAPATAEDTASQAEAEALGRNGRLAEALAKADAIQAHYLRYRTLLELADQAAGQHHLETAAKALAGAWQETEGGLAVADPLGDLASRIGRWPVGSDISLHLATILGPAPQPGLPGALRLRVLTLRHRLGASDTVDILKAGWKELDEEQRFAGAMEIEDLGLAVRAAVTPAQVAILLGKANDDWRLARVEFALKQRLDGLRDSGEAARILEWFVDSLLGQNRVAAARRLADAYPAALSLPARRLMLQRWLADDNREALVSGFLRAADDQEQRLYLDALGKMLALHPEARDRLLPAQATSPLAKDRLTNLLVSERLHQEDLAQAQALASQIADPAEAAQAQLAIARHLAAAGEFLRVRQMIREAPPPLASPLWQILAVGYAGSGSMAEAIKIVDEQLADDNRRQQAVAEIIGELVAARRHAAAILLLNRVTADQPLKLRLVYQVQAALYLDQDSADYRKIRDIEASYPMELRVEVLRDQWNLLAPQLHNDPRLLDAPETAAWLHFLRQSFFEMPAPWRELFRRLPAEDLPFVEWADALLALGRREELATLASTIWSLGTPTMRKAMLPRRLGRDPATNIVQDLAALPDPTERADLATLACTALLARREYADTLELLAVLPMEGGYWWTQLEQLAASMSRDRVELNEPMKKQLREMRARWQAATEARPLKPEFRD